MSDAFFVPDGDRFAPTELTRGPWDRDSQHAGPPAALLGRALERCEPREGAEFGRVTFEILGPVPIAPLELSARVVRPGRKVELLEGVLSGPDGPVMLARGWRLQTRAVELDPEPEREPPPPGPAESEPRPFFATGEEVGYHTAMEYRFAEGAFRELGPAVAWGRMRQALVAGEEPTPLQRTLVFADSGNGVSAVLDYHHYVFINTDLTVHLQRMPRGEWICLDAVTRPEPHGVGMADTALWDERGRIGRAAQTLLVRSRHG